MYMNTYNYFMYVRYFLVKISLEISCVGFIYFVQWSVFYIIMMYVLTFANVQSDLMTIQLQLLY